MHRDWSQRYLRSHREGGNDTQRRNGQGDDNKEAWVLEVGPWKSFAGDSRRRLYRGVVGHEGSEAFWVHHIPDVGS